MPKRKIAVFDLDDTLYKEIDYVKSGFRYISQRLDEVIPLAKRNDIFNTLWQAYLQGNDPFYEVIRKYSLSGYYKEKLLHWYRYHEPDITLEQEVKTVLDSLKERGVMMGVITDGRYETQMNKIEALGLKDYMTDIIINERQDRMKPCPYSYRYFVEKYGQGYDYFYIGDNTEKDFMAPNELGWITVCLLDDGRNIHRQTFLYENTGVPQVVKIQRLNDLLTIMNHNENSGII